MLFYKFELLLHKTQMLFYKFELLLHKFYHIADVNPEETNPEQHEIPVFEKVQVEEREVPILKEGEAEQVEEEQPHSQTQQDESSQEKAEDYELKRRTQAEAKGKNLLPHIFNLMLHILNLLLHILILLLHRPL